MPETGTSGSMSGDGKRSDGQRPQVTAPILDSTLTSFRGDQTKSVAFGGITDMAGPVDGVVSVETDADISRSTLL
jgi:hypothetical protein